MNINCSYIPNKFRENPNFGLSEDGVTNFLNVMTTRDYGRKLCLLMDGFKLGKAHINR